MELWRHPDASQQGWQHSMNQSQLVVKAVDPLKIQLEHFCQIVRGEEESVMNAEDGVKSLAVALAVDESACKGIPINL